MPRKSDNLYGIVEKLKAGTERVKLLVPFPVDRETFDRQCLPTEFWDAMSQMTVQSENARTLVPTGSHMHFCLMPRDKYRDVVASDLVSEFEKVFWIELPEGTLCQDEHTMMPLMVPPDHPFRTAVEKWYEEAAIAQRAIKTYIEMLENVFETFEDAAELAATWPDLPKLAAAKLPKRLPSIEPRREKQLQRFMDKLGVGIRMRFANDMLSASLLPEDAEPMAWVEWR